MENNEKAALPWERVLRILIHASIWFLPIMIPLVGHFIAKSESGKRMALQTLLYHILIVFIPLLFAGVLGWWGLNTSWDISRFLEMPNGMAQLANQMGNLTIWTILALLYLLLTCIVLPIVGMYRASRDEDFEYPVAGWIIPAYKR